MLKLFTIIQPYFVHLVFGIRDRDSIVVWTLLVKLYFIFIWFFWFFKYPNLITNKIVM